MELIRTRFPNGVILNHDCFDIMPKLSDKGIDLILCDLPYGTTQNRWDSVLDLEKLWLEYHRICKGPILLLASQPFTSKLVISNIYNFKHEWIWIKNRGSNFANTVREPMKEHESVLVFSQNKKWVYNKQMQERTGGGLNLIGQLQADRGAYSSSNYGNFHGKDIILTELRVPSSWQKFNCEVGLHPTQKPIALFEYLIKTYTNEGMKVLDNCSGSGTTAMACEALNRKYICIEKDPEYYRLSCERVRNKYGFREE